MRFARSSDLIIMAAFTVIAVIVALLRIDSPALRLLFALPLVFLFPGYALVSALYARRRLSETARFTFAGALSVAIVALGGLVLHFTGWQLSQNSWLLLLSAVTLAAAAVAFARRRYSAGAPGRFAFTIGSSQLLLLGVAAVLFFIALGVARESAVQHNAPEFTQFWILPSVDQENEAAQSTIELGIRNEETRAMSYQLVARLGNEVLGVWDPVELSAGEQWTTSITIPSTLTAVSALTAQLYSHDQPDQVYRSVSLALPR